MYITRFITRLVPKQEGPLAPNLRLAGPIYWICLILIIDYLHCQIRICVSCLFGETGGARTLDKQGDMPPQVILHSKMVTCGITLSFMPSGLTIDNYCQQLSLRSSLSGAVLNAPHVVYCPVLSVQIILRCVSAVTRTKNGLNVFLALHCSSTDVKTRRFILWRSFPLCLTMSIRPLRQKIERNYGDSQRKR